MTNSANCASNFLYISKFGCHYLFEFPILLYNIFFVQVPIGSSVDSVCAREVDWIRVIYCSCPVNVLHKP